MGLIEGILNGVPLFGIKFLSLFVFSLLAISCAEFQKKNNEPPPPPPTAKVTPKAPPEPEPTVSVQPPDDGLGFMDPNTTDRLITNETTKTVVGPVIPNPQPPTDDSTITIDPPKIPES